MQGAAADVQRGIGAMASAAERANNLASFSVPFMSWIAVIVLMAASLVLYLIPIRYLVMLWGCRKFSKKLMNPNHVPSSELLNFLSRVPDDPTMRKCKQLNLKDPILAAKENERRSSKKDKGGGDAELDAGSPTIVKRVSSFFEKNRPSSPSTALTRSPAVVRRQNKKDEKTEQS